MQRFLFALALLTCSTAVMAGAPKSVPEQEPQQCTPVAENDCDLVNGNATNKGPSQTGAPTNDAARRPQRKSVRQESSRNTLRFQSFLPGMIR